MLEALGKLKNSGAQSLLDSMSKAKAEQLMNDEQMEAYQEYIAAKAYQQFAVKRRDSKNITSTLKESRPMLEISPRDLDADCFAMCTPAATYDLRKGMLVQENICQKILSLKSPRCLRIIRASKFGWTASISSFKVIRNSSIMFR